MIEYRKRQKQAASAAIDGGSGGRPVYECWPNDTYALVFEGGEEASRPPAEGDGKRKSMDLTFTVFALPGLGSGESVEEQSLKGTLLRPTKAASVAVTLTALASSPPAVPPDQNTSVSFATPTTRRVGRGGDGAAGLEDEGLGRRALAWALGWACAPR